MTDKIADKIRKLIAHADSTSNQNEASAFMAKVHMLLQQHGMSLLDVGKLTEDAVGLDYRTIKTSATYGWLTHVAYALARYYGCKALSVKLKEENKVLWSVAGRESARITFTLMLPYVQRCVQDLGLEAYRSGVYGSRLQSVARIGNALAIRIDEMVLQNKRTDEAAGVATEGVNALVPVDLIDAVIAEMWPKLKTARAVTLTVDSYAHKAAKKVNLSSQVGESKAGHTKLIGGK